MGEVAQGPAPTQKEPLCDTAVFVVYSSSFRFIIICLLYSTTQFHRSRCDQYSFFMLYFIDSEIEITTLHALAMTLRLFQQNSGVQTLLNPAKISCRLHCVSKKVHPFCFHYN